MPFICSTQKHEQNLKLKRMISGGFGVRGDEAGWGGAVIVFLPWVDFVVQTCTATF